MTEFNFGSKKIEDFEIVSEFSMEDYEKYRLKSGDLTIDVAVVGIEDRDPEEYIKQRKNEISTSETEVPHPYKSQKSKQERSEDIVEFRDKNGKGLADPEYNIVEENDENIIRYKYTVIWKAFEQKKKLAEVEIYTPRENSSYQEALDIANSIILHS